MSDTKANKHYSPEFKKQVLDAIHDQHLTYSEAAKKFDVSSDSCIRSWAKTLKAEGPEGLVSKKRGPKPKDYTQPPEWNSVDDLLAENERLRAEVAYLKKLRALVQEDARQTLKKRK